MAAAGAKTVFASPVTAALDRLVAAHALAPDPLQQAAALRLDRLAVQLGLERRPSLLRKPPAPRGVYLQGRVGRGKTLLMDLFFEAAPTQNKRRAHFHEFMDEVHAGIAAFRAANKGKPGNPDPIAAVTRPLVRELKLLCLDEFQVADITNAMLLGRLFEKLFEGGVVLVATSNVAPHRLYENGLNRQLFLPFIDLLTARCDIVELDGPTDYRQLKLGGQQVFHFGTGPAVDAEMDALWLRFTGGAPGAPAELPLLGRTLHVPRAAMGAARFSFAELCEAPLGARDYLRLTNAYDLLVLDGVPTFERTRSDAAKRFILLVDTLYDRGIKLSASFAVPLDQLGQDDRTRFEFERCISRLTEMQSAAYLEAPRKDYSAA